MPAVIPRGPRIAMPGSALAHELETAISTLYNGGAPSITVKPMINKLSSFSVRVCRLAILPMVVAIVVLGDGAAPRAQGAGTVNPDDILYIMPTVETTPSGSLAGEVAEMRARFC
jgi:hypothetical protein